MGPEIEYGRYVCLCDCLCLCVFSTRCSVLTTFLVLLLLCQTSNGWLTFKACCARHKRTNCIGHFVIELDAPSKCVVLFVLCLFNLALKVCHIINIHSKLFEQGENTTEHNIRLFDAFIKCLHVHGSIKVQWSNGYGCVSASISRTKRQLSQPIRH